MAVKLIKLSCGDLLIADVEAGQTSDYILASKPLQMLIGDKGIALRMWCPCNMDTPMEIKQSHITSIADAVEPLANEYKAKFTSEPTIITPDAPKLVV
ncbi:MAG: hypothetical protein WC455_26515 [Dehalococcoidia bacterium]|jgi:hypothetical protein